MKVCEGASIVLNQNQLKIVEPCVTPGPRYDPARGRVSRESSRGESRSLVGRPQEVAGVAGWCTPQTPSSVRPGCTDLYVEDA